MCRYVREKEYVGYVGCTCVYTLCVGGVSVQGVWAISIMQCTGCIKDGTSEDNPAGSV